MGAIDDYLAARAKAVSNYTSNDLASMIYRNQMAIEEEKERKRKEQLEKQRRLNDELATVKKDIGLEKADNYVEVQKNLWNKSMKNEQEQKTPDSLSDFLSYNSQNVQAKPVYNETTGLYEEPETTSGIFGTSLAKTIVNLASFGLLKGISDKKIEEENSDTYRAIYDNLKNNEKEYVDRIGRDNYNSLMIELADKSNIKTDTLSDLKTDATYGKMDIERALAWNRYLNDGSAYNRSVAESYDEKLKDYQINNPTLGNSILPATSGNLYQQGYTLANSTLPSMAAGALTNAAVTGLTKNPAVGKAAGTAVTYIGSMVSGYNTTKDITRGMEFGNMISLGIPEDIARQASNDSASIQAIIEMSEGAKDIADVFKFPIKDKAANQLKEFFKDYGVNIITEGMEEGSQSVVGFIYEKDAMSRAGFSTADYTVSRMAEQAWEEAKGGAEVGATMFIADALPHIVIRAGVNNINQRLMVQDAPMGAVQEYLTVNSDEFGNESVTLANVKEAITKSYDNDIKIAKDFKEAAVASGNKTTIKEADELISELEKGKKKMLSDKATKAVTDGLNKTLDAQSLNKSYKLTEQQRTFAQTKLKEEQEDIRNSTIFKDIELNVADKITAGQSALIKFAKMLGVDVYYYTATKNTAINSKNQESIYKSNGIFVGGTNSIFINTSNRTTKNALSVVGHEYAHSNVERMFKKAQKALNEILESKNVEANQKVVESARAFFDNLYNSYSNQTARNYGQKHHVGNYVSAEELNSWRNILGKNVSQDYIYLLRVKEELYADSVGEYLSSKDAVNQIESNEKSAFKAIKNIVANYIENTTGTRPETGLNQFNLEGVSTLNGRELNAELKTQVMEDIKERQQKSKLSKKETTQEKPTPKLSKKENTATKLTPEQKSNESWYRGQREDNKSRDAIQKSLALRMNRGVNSTEVKAELDRLEKKYNEANRAKRSAEISEATEADYSKGYRASNGTRITNAVAEWAEDSKLRGFSDELDLYYHGSPWLFEEFKDTYTHNGKSLGDGYYLTANKNKAEKSYAYSKGDTVYTLVLNVKNPFNLDAWRRDKQKILDKLPELIKKFDQDGLEKYKRWGEDGYIEEMRLLIDEGTGTLADYIHHDPDEYDTISAINDIASRNGVDTRDIWKWLGYDGLQVRDEVVIFDSNQAKEPSNPNPTSDPRFKRSAEIVDKQGQKNPRLYNSIGDKLTPGQVKKYKNSVVRDKDGNLLVVYHTTTGTFLIPFAKFTPEKDGKNYRYRGQTVIFVTPSLAMSTSYAQLKGIGNKENLQDIFETGAIKTVEKNNVKSVAQANAILDENFGSEYKVVKDNKGDYIIESNRQRQKRY